MSYYKYLIAFLVFFLYSCSFSQRIKDGETAFERKQFSVAIDLLSQEFEGTKHETVKARKAFLLGKANLILLDYEESLAWFQKAVDLNYGTEAIGNLANLFKMTENYDAAITQYKLLGQATGRTQEMDKEVLLCRQALDAKNRKPTYTIDRLYENSTTSDYAPVLYDKDYIVFTSERKESNGGVYKWTGEKFTDLYIMLKTGSDVRKFDSAINTGKNEGTACFTQDMNIMYFTRCLSENNGDEHCKLMKTQKIDGVWDEADVLPFVTDDFNYGQPALIENDSVLVFVTYSAETQDRSDLYYAKLQDNNIWSQPEKLPSRINTTGNERFPTADGDTLYFSSDYLPGLGGYDIFKTYLRKDGSWSNPINLGFPINSGGDDFSFIIDRHANLPSNVEQKGFFSSSRNGSGKDDIYRFNKLKPTEKPIDSIPTKKDDIKTFYVTIKTFSKQFEIPDDPNSKVIGQIPLGNALVKIIDGNQKWKDAYTDKNGFYFTEVPADKTFNIIAAALGYLNASSEVSTKNVSFKEGENSFTINCSMILDKIYSDKEINLSNIYYDFDKWDIKPEAKPTLDQLVKILNDNPQVNIQLSSHTDCRGDEKYNEVLSQNRAQSVVEYLIKSNIKPDRLVAKGYGESQLIDHCECEKCTEDQHQANRRTTFKILK